MSDFRTPERTMVAPAGGFSAPQQMGATQQMPAGGFAGDAFRTQMGGTTVCPVCKTTTPLGELYCGECGFLLSSPPAESVEMPAEEPALMELVDSQSGRRYRLRAGVNTVGRQGTDIILNEGTVSRAHARISLDEDRVVVEDLGSSNGTKVGDLRIQANQPTEATLGIALRFGNWTGVLEPGASVPTGGTGMADGTAAGPTDRTILQMPGAAAAPSGTPASVEEVPLPGDAIAVLRSVDGPGSSIRLAEGVVTLGRKTGNSVVLAGDSYVSGRHAELTSNMNGTILKDLGSTNGTLVNGNKLTPDDPQLLLEGDEIQLGQTRYRFELVEVEETQESPESQPAPATDTPAFDIPAAPTEPHAASEEPA